MVEIGEPVYMIHSDHRDMDKKSKILMWTLVLLTVASIGYTFWKTVIQQDFVVSEDVPVKE